MRTLFNYALTYALSPFGTAMNTVALVVVLLAWGADPSRAFFWLAVLLFAASSAYLDVRVYLLRRRRGLTALQATEAMTDTVWGPRKEES